MKKLLASDLDGTLLIDNNVPEENKKAVLSLINSNNIFAVSTGRPYNGVEFLEREHNIKIHYYVLLNGALILDGNKKVIKHEIIKKNTIKEILKKFTDGDTSISIESGYYTYFLTECTQITYDKTVRVESLEEILEELSLISLSMDKRSIEEIEERKNRINKEYGNEVVAYRNSRFIDVVPVGCSKGEGIKYISHKENVRNDNIYTIGDSWNDVTMFEITNNAFTFHHVEEGLKSYANHLVSSVAECIEVYM